MCNLHSNYTKIKHYLESNLDELFKEAYDLKVKFEKKTTWKAFLCAIMQEVDIEKFSLIKQLNMSKHVAHPCALHFAIQ